VNTDTMQTSKPIRLSEASLHVVRLSADGTRLVVLYDIPRVGEDPQFHTEVGVWNANTGDLLWKEHAADDYSLRDLAVLPEDTVVVWGYNQVKAWGLATHQRLAENQVNRILASVAGTEGLPKSSVRSLLSPDHRFNLVQTEIPSSDANANSRERAWSLRLQNARTGKEYWRRQIAAEPQTLFGESSIRQNNIGIVPPTFTPDSRAVLILDGASLLVLSSETGNLVWPPEPVRFLTALAFTPDGRFLLTGDSSNHAVQLWPLRPRWQCW
jgi:WD40 repeat protein